MARVKWMTRTVVTSKVGCTVLRADNNEMTTVTMTLSGDWTGVEIAKVKRELEKKADDNLQFSFNGKDGKTFKANLIRIDSVKSVEKLYWMEEDKFIANATKVTDGRDVTGASK